jgi:hypothetical protein
MKGYHPTRSYHLQAGIHQTCYGWTIVDPPQWPLTSYEYSTHDPAVDVVYIIPLPEDTPIKETMDPKKLHRICTPDSMRTNALLAVVTVPNIAGTLYGEATELYSKDWKYLEEWK